MASVNRQNKLIDDYNSMLLLREKAPTIIEFVTKDTVSPPQEYEVVMKIKSLIKTGRDIVEHNRFTFHIDLTNRHPKCYVADAKHPFHPHFTVETFAFFNRVQWVDYKPYDPAESLGDFVLRIAHSLQYDPGYINIHKTTNHEAEQWYIKQKANGRRFPIDETELPPCLIQKRFEIQNKHKTFEVQSSQHNNPADSRTIRIDYNEGSRKTFEVTEEIPPYQPEMQDEPNFNLVEHFSAENDVRSKYRLYLTQKAVKIIHEHIGWGKDTDDNKVEQGGVLLGRVFKDPVSGMYYGIVEDAFAARTSRASAAHIEMSHETWQDIYNRIDQHIENEILHIIGWYHTHPNNLNVFMSTTDMATQKRVFNQDWLFAVVMNPHKQKWKVYQGCDAKQCSGYVIEEASHKENSREPSTYPLTLQDEVAWIETKTSKSQNKRILRIACIICIAFIMISALAYDYLKAYIQTGLNNFKGLNVTVKITKDNLDINYISKATDNMTENSITTSSKTSPATNAIETDDPKIKNFGELLSFINDNKNADNATIKHVATSLTHILGNYRKDFTLKYDPNLRYLPIDKGKGVYKKNPPRDIFSIFRDKIQQNKKNYVEYKITIIKGNADIFTMTGGVVISKTNKELWIYDVLQSALYNYEYEGGFSVKENAMFDKIVDDNERNIGIIDSSKSLTIRHYKVNQDSSVTLTKDQDLEQAINPQKEQKKNKK
ncbi:MAG: hypothetical protein HQL06_11055 [Nitrospirae bacterium]|nr:hypothetical protein [Nitrospirota bacterium]